MSTLLNPRKLGTLQHRPWLGPVVLTVLLAVVSLIPLLWFGRFYFRGDMQAAYVGWWYHLGEQVRQGNLPLMEPRAWEAGNYLAEGQWGLFSPLTIVIALLTTVVPNLVVFVTGLNIALLLCGGLGTYVLVRSYRARAPFAMVAGLVVGLSGASVFNDWPSWVNGHIGVALLPWAWWLTRRAMAGRNPAPALVVAYLIVAVGYVYCAAYLAVVLIACLTDAVMSRSRRQILTVLAFCVFSGLVTVAVYLPGILTSPVTDRNSLDITGPGLLIAQPHEMVASMLPTVRRTYLVWLLPAVLWLDLRRLERSFRDLAGAAVATTLLAMWVMGPATIGPLRWPLRVAPALMVPLVVLLLVAASRALVRPSTGRVLASLGWLCFASYLLVARETELTPDVAAGVAMVTAALGTTAWALRRRADRTATALAMAWTIAMLVAQFVTDPVPGGADRNMPAQASAYQGRLSSAQGDVMVLGKPSGPLIHEPELADELLVGSMWYLSGKDVQNGYTTINFRAFEDRFCRNYTGGTCRGSLNSVLATEPTTGKRWVDLLSVSTLAFYRPDFRPGALRRPAQGFDVTQSSTNTLVWTRSTPVPTAGGVVATTPGLAVRELHRSDQEVALRVTSSGPSGGTLTLSRLAWPGYAVHGGTLGQPLDGVLVRVNVPADSRGSVVTVRWDPPGWGLERVALWAAILMGFLWAATALVLPRRRRWTTTKRDPLPRV